MPESVELEAEHIRAQVSESYGEVARGESLLGRVAKGDALAWSARYGYGTKQLANAPEGSITGLGCGNPTALAVLRPGETVVDLGCGAGFDLVLAAAAVGTSGRAIGVDITVEMIALARRAIREAGLLQAEVRLAPMERLPLASASVDVVLSNCAINLSPEKEKVAREVHRILRPGGRIVVADMVVYEQLPPEVTTLLDSYVGCIGGALVRSDYLQVFSGAGFENVEVTQEICLGDVLTPDHPYVAEIVRQTGRRDGPKKVQQLLAQIGSVTLQAAKANR